jgi:hypothetical protein
VVDTNFVKPGRSLCFAGAELTADGVPVARAHATFHIVTPKVYESSSS